MSDFIVWYAPQVFMAAMIVLTVIALAVAAIKISRELHYSEPEFEHVEVLDE